MVGVGAPLRRETSGIVSSAIFLRPHTFVRGLRAAQPAVAGGLGMPYSNDPIEGANTKVKLLQRQMYGRAGFPVLRQRILLS
jgi:transposase